MNVVKESKVSHFLMRKNIEFSAKRYAIDTLVAMAHGLFASLLISKIISTISSKMILLGGEFTRICAVFDQIAAYAKEGTGAAMAVAIGYALKCPPLVLFSLIAVGQSANGLGGPLSVLVIAVISAEVGKAVSKETKIDIIVTPLLIITTGVILSILFAPVIGHGASAVGDIIVQQFVRHYR